VKLEQVYEKSSARDGSAAPHPSFSGLSMPEIRAELWDYIAHADAGAIVALTWIVAQIRRADRLWRAGALPPTGTVLRFPERHGSLKGLEHALVEDG